MQPQKIQPPKFSVIIPNYNNSSTLKRALLSVIHQSYPAHEIIVVDDGSTDESAQILEQFKDKIICLYQKNSGVSGARNNGARIATGEWIAFLDADDVFYPDRLRLHAEWIQDEPDLDFLLAEQESRNSNGEFLNFFMKSSTLGKLLLARHKNEDRIPIPHTLFGELISDGFTEIRTLSVPKNKFLRLSGFPIEHKIGEDLYFFIRLFAESKKAGVVPQTLATYYIYETSTLRRDALSTMRLFDATLRSLEEHLRTAPPHIKQGFLAKYRKVKLSLAYALLRSGRKKEAILAVAPFIFRRPGIQSIMDLISICRGIRTESRIRNSN